MILTNNQCFSKQELINSLDIFIDNTLNKVNGVNKPFKAIQKTDEYKKFESMFATNIRKQATWIIDNLIDLLDSAGISDDLNPLSSSQINKLKGQISRDMPALSTFISSSKIFGQLKDFFEWSAVQQYKRWGYVAKYDGIKFTLTNAKYIEQLQNSADYLLNESSLDSTTIDDIISTISDGRLAGMTNSEVAQIINDKFDDLSKSRADMIARTESAQAMGSANYATASENGAQTKQWVAAGGSDDEICGGNADEGFIGIDEEFQSGDMYEPGHPNCECYT